LLIVLTGIDGSGKTTAAQALTRDPGALLLSNYAGRRRMSLIADRFGLRFPARVADTVETTIRTFNVLVSHARAHNHRGLVVMDRHLYCQLALRQAKGLPRGRFMPCLLSILPKPDVVVHLVVDPEQALRRVLARGTDTESLEELSVLDAAYRSLPEYEDFLKLDASGTPDEVLAALSGLLQASAAGGRALTASPR
jgi:dTMP kinase